MQGVQCQSNTGEQPGVRINGKTEAMTASVFRILPPMRFYSPDGFFPGASYLLMHSGRSLYVITTEDFTHSL